MDTGFNTTGVIYGIDNGSYNNATGWYMSGNSDGANWVELIKVKEGFNVSNNNQGDQWVIRGTDGEFGQD
jgi:hypothetical protein